MILRSEPKVFGQHLTAEIGAPQDYCKNKESVNFPESYDHGVPGADNVTMAEPASPPQKASGEESKQTLDEIMRSATTSKTMDSRPSSAFMPIKALNQFTNDWVIKARVVKKAPIREWKNAKSSGKLLNFDLIDKEGTMIQGTAFNEAAENFDSMLSGEGVYTFANGMVKLANKRFTAIPNDHCLTFGKDSIVQQCAEDDEIESVSFTFTGLNQIEDILQSKTVDVIGVILDVGPVSSINMRDGKVRNKRLLTIGDESHVCIGVTLWGSVADAHSYSTGQVIAFKSCRVSDYNGKSLNASSYADEIHVGSKVKHERATELEAWVRGSTMGALRDEMRPLGELPGADGQKKKSSTPTLLIAQLKELAQSDGEIMGGKPFYCNLNCDLSWVFVPENTDR